ncbi:MAG TPA: hypothetical protein VHU89_10230 [Acidobacteriaceae bacterium]|nr:hypothetical protein [Acidobacteriaceae bacterium]
MHNQVFLLSKDQNQVLPFRSGVSLHGHTRHSREGLGFIGKFLQSHRTLKKWIEVQGTHCRRTSGISLDFERAYWTPPLCERAALALEERQIAGLGLRPFVSLTDHDRIDACALLCQSMESRCVPISTEWTVPFGRVIFHIGVHNLPPVGADSFMAAMRQATAAADERLIFTLFAELCSIPDVLLVFNHPLWNFDKVPGEVFQAELRRFLESANPYMHAFELNGMRCHEENRDVLRLAGAWDQLLISGGDRHGCEPNALLNLTNAADFPEFVEEIRKGRHSTVAIMPQYEQPFGWRMYQNFTHVIADYPDYPEDRRRWDQRTFHPDRAGSAIVPMAQLWKVDPPEFLKTIFSLALAASHLPVSSLLRRWMVANNESLVFPEAWPVQDATPEAAIRAALLDGQPRTRRDDYLLGRTEPAAD